MNDECLICKAPLKYAETDKMMYMAIVTKSRPLAKEAWGLSNQMTARALDAIGKNGGPRCCKRDSYLAIMEAVFFTGKKWAFKWN